MRRHPFITQIVHNLISNTNYTGRNAVYMLRLYKSQCLRKLHMTEVCWTLLFLRYSELSRKSFSLQIRQWKRRLNDQILEIPPIVVAQKFVQVDWDCGVWGSFDSCKITKFGRARSILPSPSTTSRPSIGSMGNGSNPRAMTNQTSETESGPSPVRKKRGAARRACNNCAQNKVLIFRITTPTSPGTN